MDEEKFTQSEPVQIQEPKKNNIAIVAVIIVIVAITAGVIGWLVARKTQAPIIQPVVTQPVQQAPVTQPVADETVPSSPQNGFQQDGKTIRGYSIEAYFEDGVLNVNDSEVIFSPKNRIMPKAGEQQPVGVPDDIYEMIVQDYRTADVIIKEASQQQLLTKKPIQKNINNFVVVEYTEGGFCDNRYAEVVGKNHNYMFTSLGCAHSEKEDFDSFEKVISTFKFTDLVADETANWQTYSNNEYGFSFKYPSGWVLNWIVSDKWSGHEDEGMDAFIGSSDEACSENRFRLSDGSGKSDCGFYLAIYPGISLQELLALKTSGKKLRTKIDDINNKPFTFYRLKDGNGEGNYTNWYAIGLKSGGSFEINGNNSTKNTTNKLLSTFKFTK